MIITLHIPYSKFYQRLVKSWMQKAKTRIQIPPYEFISAYTLGLMAYKFLFPITILLKIDTNSMCGKGRGSERTMLTRMKLGFGLLIPRAPGVPRSCQMDGRATTTNIGSWFNRYTCKRCPDRVSGRTLRWFC